MTIESGFDNVNSSVSDARLSSAPIRVCIVVESHVKIRTGGAEYQAHLLAQELARRAGVEVTYLGRHLPASEGIDYGLRQIGHDRGIRRRAVAFDGPALWRALCELRPDVIYQRMRQSYTAVCSLHSRKFGVPFIFHAALDSDVGSSGESVRLSANLPFDLVESVAGSWGVRHADHLVVQTERQAELLRLNFGREPSAIVRNFQPLPATLPVKKVGRTRILWVANLKESKRPQLFMELAERFAGRNDLEFLMVGRPASHRRFRSTMERVRSSPYVEYLGGLAIDEVNSLMNEADVFVNTSLIEGSPNTFIQAWARGAVVASLSVDIDGGLEAAGIGFRTDSLQRLAEVIEQLTQQPRLRREIAARAFAYVHSRHSLRNAAALSDIILETARRRRRASH